MGARILSLVLPIMALLAMGSASAAPDMMMKWQSRNCATLLDSQRQAALPNSGIFVPQQVGATRTR